MNLLRLRILLTLFFVALAAPTLILVHHAYGQLKWEAFHQYQQLARDMGIQIDARFTALIEQEQNRPFSDYSFLNVAGDETTAFIQRSPLTRFPGESDTPGVLGYFQIDAQDQLSTPLLPEIGSQSPAGQTYGLSAENLKNRRQLANKIHDVLAQNQFIRQRIKPKIETEQHLTLSPENNGSGSDDDSDSDDGSDFDIVVVNSEQKLSSYQLTQFATPELPQVTFESERSAESSSPGFDKLKEQKTNPAASRSKNNQRVDDLELESNYIDKASAQAKPDLRQQGESERQHKSELLRKREQQRTEKVLLPAPEPAFNEALPESQLAAQLSASADNGYTDSLHQQQTVRIQSFETEIDPFEFRVLDSGHYLLYRRVWRNGERHIQGLLLNPEPFLSKLIKPLFESSLLASSGDLILAHQGDVVDVYQAQSERYLVSNSDGRQQSRENELLYQNRLSVPFDQLELIFRLTELSSGPGSKVIIWVAAILALVLCGGFFLLYRLAARQIGLVQQQQDFVSAVSHELKTPLTSIRMYGEMLREGWVDNDKKKSYYDFIFTESERLSRLINNVLHLARMSRNDQKPECKNRSVSELISELHPKLITQLQSSGFQLKLKAEDSGSTATVYVDSDWITQILINLIDNAAKFSRDADARVVEVYSSITSDHHWQIRVRDFGPGIASNQIKKIFKLFYRSENELTRETQGTGIGLALVQQLVSGMSGKVDVRNREPGAEFCIRFPLVSTH